MGSWWFTHGFTHVESPWEILSPDLHREQQQAHQGRRQGTMGHAQAQRFHQARLDRKSMALNHGHTWGITRKNPHEIAIDPDEIPSG